MDTYEQKVSWIERVEDAEHELLTGPYV